MRYNDRLKEQRKKLRYTQKELAEKVKVSSQVISNWERGYTEPSAEDLNRLAEALGCSSDYLLGLTNQPHHHSNDLIFNKGTTIYFKDYVISLKDDSSWDDLKESYPHFPSLNEVHKVKADENNGSHVFHIILKEEASDYNFDNDLARQLASLKEHIEKSDSLTFEGEPLSKETKESLIESVELLLKQTQRINKIQQSKND